MSKHTPGPWTVFVPPDYAGTGCRTGLGIDAPTGAAVVWYRAGPEEGIQNDADAPLIAAAPELLEELSEARTDLMIAAGNMDNAARYDPTWQGCGDTLRKRIERIDAVLEKARGEGIY